MEKSQEFKSDHVTFTATREPECIAKYEVKVSAEIVKQARKKALRTISKEVSLPGFRKGRAPDHLILKKFPKPVEEEWQKAIANAAFNECQKLSDIPLLSNDAHISFNIDKHSLEEGAEMTYSFETEPVIPEIDPATITLEEIKLQPINDKKIQETLGDIQMFFAEWEKVTNRKAKVGDFAVIDIDIIETETPQKALSSARFEIQKEKMAKWMFEIIVGMKPEEVKEGVSQPDPDASEKEKEETPPKKVRVTLRHLEQPKLPEIDDAFAEKLGAKDAKELMENLEKLLKKREEDLQQRGYREQIANYLLKECPFELPKTLLQKETQFRIKQLLADPAFQRKVSGMSKEEQENTVKEIETQAERAVRLFYLSKKIIQDHKISVSPREVDREEKTPLEALFNDPADVYTAKEESQEQKALAMSRLILSKAEDFILSNATIEPKKKEAKPKKVEEAKKPAKKVAPKKKAPKKKSWPELHRKSIKE